MRATENPSRYIWVPATPQKRVLGPAKIIYNKELRNVSEFSAKEKNLFSNKYLAGVGGGEPRVTKGSPRPGLFDCPAQWSGRAKPGIARADRLISTWSGRNLIRGLRSVGQPRHVNLFSMRCAEEL